jgi:hypothetical protein
MLLLLACTAGTDSLFDRFLETGTEDRVGSYAFVAHGSAELVALALDEPVVAVSADPDVVAVGAVTDGRLSLVTGVAGSTELVLVDQGGRVLDSVMVSVEEPVDAMVVPMAAHAVPELARAPIRAVAGGAVLLDAQLFGASGLLAGRPADRACDEPAPDDSCGDAVILGGGLFGIQSADPGAIDLGEWLGPAFDGQVVTVVAPDAVDRLETRIERVDGRGRVLALAVDADGLPILGARPTWRSETGAVPPGEGDLYTYEDDPSAPPTEYTVTFGDRSAVFEVHERAMGTVADAATGCASTAGPRGVGIVIFGFVAAFMRRDRKYLGR